MKATTLLTTREARRRNQQSHIRPVPEKAYLLLLAACIDFAGDNSRRVLYCVPEPVR